MTSYMTPYVEKDAWYKKYNVFRMFLCHVEQLQSLSSFWKKYFYVLETAIKLIRLLKIIRVMYTNGVKCRIWGMVWKKILLQNIPIIMWNSFKHGQLFLKTNFQGLKRQLVVTLVKNDKIMSLNDVIHQIKDMIW